VVVSSSVSWSERHGYGLPLEAASFAPLLVATVIAGLSPVLRNFTSLKTLVASLFGKNNSKGQAQC
jgi:hypothetical protein